MTKKCIILTSGVICLEYNYEKDYVNEETGFMLRYIFSETEPFVEHWHDYYEIFLMLEGSTLHKANGIQQMLTEGYLVFIRPGDVHDYKCKEKCRFLNLAFSKETMNELISYFGSGFNAQRILDSKYPPISVLTAGEKERMFKKFQKINTLELNSNTKFRFYMRVFLAEIMASCFSDTLYSLSEDIPHWLEILCFKMNTKDNFTAGISRMTELSGCSKEHLSRSMKKYYGVTVTEFINDLRLNYAANMLKNSNMSILDICYDCGFDNTSYFHRKFKEKYDVTPLKFRTLNIERFI